MTGEWADVSVICQASSLQCPSVDTPVACFKQGIVGGIGGVLLFCCCCRSSFHEPYAVLTHALAVAACSQLLVNTCVDLVDLLEAHQPEAGSSTGASSSTTAAAGSSRTVGADSSTPPGDWWAVSCRQIGQLLLQVAVQPCSGSSSSSSDSTASDTGSCLLQLQRLLVLQPGALPVSCCPALGCLLLALEGPQVRGAWPAMQLLLTQSCVLSVLRSSSQAARL
jgi:hypothetical protein